MSRTVQIAASLPAPPAQLFDMYLDPVRHTAFTGQPTKISDREGSAFEAFGGMLSGKILQVIPKRLIVQSWRAAHWPSDAIDSTLVLSFFSAPNGGRIELTQVNVVDYDFADVSQGWEKYYWTPWLAYLEAKQDS
jgi:activator of HSP90 ATPase